MLRHSPWSATRGSRSPATRSSSSRSVTRPRPGSTGTPRSPGARPAAPPPSTCIPGETVRQLAGDHRLRDRPRGRRRRRRARGRRGPDREHPRHPSGQLGTRLRLRRAELPVRLVRRDLLQLLVAGSGRLEPGRPRADRRRARRHRALAESEHPVGDAVRILTRTSAAVTVPSGLTAANPPRSSGRPILMSRIALLPSSYPPALGGVEELTRHLALALRAAGDEVEVWTGQPDDRDPETAEIRDGLVVRRLPMPLPATNWSSIRRSATTGVDTLVSLRSAVAAFRPDVLHVQCFGPNGVYATALSRLTGIPLVITLQGETLMDDADIFEISRVLRFSLRRGIRRAKAVTGCSSFTLADAVARFGLDQGLGPGGPERRRPDRGGRTGVRRRRASAASGRPYVFALGRVVEKKGFDLLLAAYAALDAAHRDRVDVVLAGEGPALPGTPRPGGGARHRRARPLRRASRPRRGGGGDGRRRAVGGAEPPRALRHRDPRGVAGRHRGGRDRPRRAPRVDRRRRRRCPRRSLRCHRLRPRARLADRRTGTRRAALARCGSGPGGGVRLATGGRAVPRDLRRGRRRRPATQRRPRWTVAFTTSVRENRSDDFERPRDRRRGRRFAPGARDAPGGGSRPPVGAHPRSGWASTSSRSPRSPSRWTHTGTATWSGSSRLTSSPRCRSGAETTAMPPSRWRRASPPRRR